MTMCRGPGTINREGRPEGADRDVSILGTRVLRTEDPGFLTTGGVYTDDVVDERLAGACHVFFVRSPIAHARIRSVDVSAALQAPGVVAAFTGADLADLPLLAPPMPGMIDERMAEPRVARDVVRFVGEPVAVVITDDPYQGEDAAELVDADYEPLTPVIDLAEAADGRPGMLFPDAGTNIAATFGDAAGLKDVAVVGGLQSFRHALFDQQDRQLRLPADFDQPFEDEIRNARREAHRWFIQHQQFG